MNSEWVRMGLSAPVNVTWEITLKCMLRCSHCLSDSGVASPAELNTDACKQLISQLSHLKVFQVNIGGGEPFAREDFLELLSFAQAKGLVTCVSTNGMVMDDSLAKRLASLRGLYLQLSLDGATKAVNDPIRGQGTYDRILEAADRLVRYRVGFSFNTVLTRLNYPQLEEMRRLAASYGSELRVSRFRPAGRGKQVHAALGPTSQQLEDFADWLARHDKVKTGDSFFCLTSENRRRKGLDMCGAAKMTCCIAPDGNVYPCAFLQDKAFLAGNVRTTDFKQLWDKSQVFLSLRNLNIEACHACPRFESCRGGCPAMAYHLYNSIHLPDPECLMNLKAVS